MQIKIPRKWDGGWRIIIFDIPEKFRKLRGSIRYHLKKLGFRELQKSVWIHPFECLDEINFLSTLYDASEYIRFIRAHHINNEEELKKWFKL